MMEESFSFQAMNTDIQLSGESSWQNGWKEELKEWFLTFEHTCSRFLPSNELAIFNRSPIGTTMKVSSMLFYVLKEAIHYMKQTKAYFNPLMGRNMAIIGYDQSFERIKAGGNSTNIAMKKRQIAPLQFDDHLCMITKQTEEKVDLGGFGKGWAVDQGARFMRQVGVVEGILNAGGDLSVWGDQEKLIGIANPEKEHIDLAQFYFTQGSVATSNKKHRSWKQGLFKRHHLLNGQTGLQADSNVIQATVFSKTAAESEVIAKVLCVLSFEEGLSWMLEHFPYAAAVIIHENGQVKVSHTIHHYTRKLMF